MGHIGLFGLRYRVYWAISKWDDERKVRFIENKFNSIEGVNVKIFPMTELNDFCKEKFKDNYLKVFLLGRNLYPFDVDDDFSPNDFWCLWNEVDGTLRVSDSILYFVSLTDVLFWNNVFNSSDLHILGFSDTEAQELLKSYEECKSKKK